MTTTTGFIAIDHNGTIWGVGATEEIAVSDMRREIESAGEDMGEFDTVPATPALLAMVQSHGGSCKWENVDGVAMTRAEMEQVFA